MHTIALLLLALSASAADIVISDLTGVWTLNFAGYDYTIVIDGRNPEQAWIGVNQKMAVLNSEDTEAGRGTIENGSLVFSVLGQDGKELRRRRYALRSIEGDVLRVQWDNPNGDVELHRVQRDLPARQP